MELYGTERLSIIKEENALILEFRRLWRLGRVVDCRCLDGRVTG